MDILSLSFVSLHIELAAVPNTVINILIGHLIEYSITGKHNEIMSLSYLEHLHLRVGNHHTGVPIFVFQFGFGVSEGSRHGETTWQNTDWTNDEVCLLVSFSFVFLNISSCSSLVNRSTPCNDSFVFIDI